jgi:hypothetical protein
MHCRKNLRKSRANPGLRDEEKEGNPMLPNMSDYQGNAFTETSGEEIAKVKRVWPDDAENTDLQ